MGLRRPKSTKNPPFLSHEFIIQNHADAVSCIMMVFVIGLMFQATAPYASVFVAMQHQINTTTSEAEEQNLEPETTFYTYGWKDVFTVSFYFMLCIVIHAVLQEYVLDKLNRRVHLSKIKHSKFNESGQLMVFYLISVVWGANIILAENLIGNIADLWEGYPYTHSSLPFVVKFFFIIQMAYWLHGFPELYFMKIKKDEMLSRVNYLSLYLCFISAAYMLNFNRVAVCMLVMHYFIEFLFHASRLLYFAEKTELANSGFVIWDILFVLVRLVSITLSVLTFWYGLGKTSQEKYDWVDGNFNTFIIRLSCLAAICFVQAWMMWRFITFHLKRCRERTAASNKKVITPSKKIKDKRSKSSKKDEDISLLPEVDQQNAISNENGGLKSRSAKKRN